MNTDLLLALGLALLLGGVVGGVLLLRARRRPVRPPLPRPVVTPAAAPHAAPLAPPPAGAAPPAGPPDTAALIDAQRQAATEALRLARQRKAEEAARLQAERERQARADAQAQAHDATRLLHRPLPPQAPAPPAPAAAPPPALTPRMADAQLLGALSIGPAASSAGTAATPGLAPLRRAQPVRPPVVLLADDSKVVRVKTGRLLEKQGWQVLLAEDGEAALQALDQHAPDLLITDVEMPGIDGFELTRRLRAQPRFARLPVIMITSSDARHRAEANAAGVNLLLGKPYAEETLLLQVKAMLAAAAQRNGAPLALH